MLRKSIAAVVVSAAALATLSTGASAHGCGHFGFHAFRAFPIVATPSPYYLAQLRAKKAAEARAIARAKMEKQIELKQAMAEKKAEAAKLAAKKDSDTTSNAKVEKAVATTEPVVTKTEEPVVVADAAATCTRFVPAVGKAIPVDCPKN